LLPSEQQVWSEYAQLNAGAIAIAQGLQALRQIDRPLTPEETNQKQQLDQQQRQLVRQFREFSTRDDIVSYTEALTRTAREQSLSLPRLQDLSQNLRDLEEPAVLLYPLILEDRIELVLVAPGVPPIHTPVNVDRITLNQAIQTYRDALTSPAKNPLPAAQQLYDWLIRPVESHLTQAQAQTILYAPDGPLRYVPLAALHDGDTWLIEHFRINNITAASLDDLNRKPATERRILAGAFSDPSTRYEVSGGGVPGREKTFGFNGLPYAGVEVEALQALQPDSTVHLNPDFSRERILPNMDDYPIVHLATHAAFLPGSPLDSFVLFGNGETITLQEVQDEWFFGNLDLIVLSACQTGLSSLGESGEEILGFGYLMQNAGVNAAMASLWTVDDGGTQTLMDAFYTGLLKNDLTKAEALRQAQLALIGSSAGSLMSSRGGLARITQENETDSQRWNRLSHPYYWSPFILIGNGL
ncbi:MAG: CHAT domain-containing protein, partial [Cyanobacteria bacterium J06598_3]